MNGWNMKSVVHSVVIIINGRRHCGIKMNGWKMKSVVHSMVIFNNKG